MDKQPEIVHHHDINLPQYSFGMAGPEVINTNPVEIKESKETRLIDEEMIRRIVREELNKRETEKKSATSGAHNFGLSPISNNIIYKEDGSIVIHMNKAI